MSLEPTPLTPELYRYLLAISLREPRVCQDLRRAAASDENHNMQISPDLGQFLGFLLRLLDAKRCIEIGTYMGYSALWMALHLTSDDARLLTCDISDKWRDTALYYWQRAHVAHKIKLEVRPALETLKLLLQNNANKNAFDFAFIDADKENYVHYYEACFALLRPGGLVAFDNTLWSGDVVRAEVNTPSTQAIRQLNTHLTHDVRIDLSMLPISDGLTLARKR